METLKILRKIRHDDFLFKKLKKNQIWSPSETHRSQTQKNIGLVKTLICDIHMYLLPKDDLYHDDYERLK